MIAARLEFLMPDLRLQEIVYDLGILLVPKHTTVVRGMHTRVVVHRHGA